MFRCLALSLSCLFAGSLVLPAQPQGVLLDVPYVKQEKNGCGAASLAMMMAYWDRERGRSSTVDAKEIQQALYSPQARGILASSLVSYLQERGFETHAFGGKWIDVKEHLARGRPLIVALRPGRGDLHYVVLTGFDAQRDVVILHDPARRRHSKQHRAAFERQWKGAQNWTLLALPRAEPASPSP
jgi:ABC-type bacteriocin/lantibiotic exporter with double-glycine peptidase domain